MVQEVDTRINRFVAKEWGWELEVENNDLYCLKVLTCIDSKWSSGGDMHYHKIKDETFFVIEGALELEVQLEDGIYSSFHLLEGNKYRIHPGVHHRFRSVGIRCKFVEGSTHHSDEDSYRVPKDKQ